MILYNFKNIRPQHVVDQSHTLSWISKGHARAESKNNYDNKPIDEEKFAGKIARLLKRYSCSSKQIAHRGLETKDFSHTNWEKMELFNCNNGQYGPTMGQRSSEFRKIGDRVCKELLPKDLTPPDHIIHVTCTGYLSPSCIQERVSQNHWGEKTTVTHAYHMGCYAAMPAIRIAEGLLAASNKNKLQEEDSQRVDILHTEVCSLHVQLHDHSPEQLVVQSLFADGFIVYSAVSPQNAKNILGPGLLVKALHEEIIPDSETAITWECSEWGMIMGLSARVPKLIADTLKPFIHRLCKQADISYENINKNSIFAIHPGGPKIIDSVQKQLELTDDQVQASRKVLKEHGNMSSATLPHVWERIIADTTIASGTYIISLAFGPGLCISGAISQKVDY